eukprot:scaffold201893_cov25-Tisochrysis_lutea.AAC.2
MADGHQYMVLTSVFYDIDRGHKSSLAKTMRSKDSRLFSRQGNIQPLAVKVDATCNPFSSSHGVLFKRLGALTI